MLRNRILTAIAGAVLATPAFAADLPPAPPAIDYVQVCSSLGSGFLRVPGTETCLRIGGRVRADFNVFMDLKDDDFDIEPDYGFGSTEKTGYRMRARGNAYLDARQQTELGRLRTYLDLQFTKDSDKDDASVELKHGFIQWGGLTAGRANSYYDFRGNQFTVTEFFDPQFSRDSQQLLIGYEAHFGERFSASLSLEDNTGRRSGIASDSFVTEYGGAKIPDVIARLQWGTDSDAAYAQLMGATHYVNTYTEGPGVTNDALGFAVGAGVAADVPVGNGTRFGLTGTYARGARDFATTSASGPFGLVSDGVYDPVSRDVNLTEAFTVAAGGETDIAPDVTLAFQVGLLLADTANSNTDFNNDGVEDDLAVRNLDLQGFIGWRPVSGLLIGGGAEYRYATTADFGDASFLTTYVRIQRSF